MMRPAGPGPPSGDCKTGNTHFWRGDGGGANCRRCQGPGAALLGACGQTPLCPPLPVSVPRVKSSGWSLEGTGGEAGQQPASCPRPWVLGVVFFAGLSLTIRPRGWASGQTDTVPRAGQACQTTGACGHSLRCTLSTVGGWNGAPWDMTSPAVRPALSCHCPSMPAFPAVPGGGHLPPRGVLWVKTLHGAESGCAQPLPSGLAGCMALMPLEPSFRGACWVKGQVGALEPRDPEHRGRGPSTRRLSCTDLDSFVPSCSCLPDPLSLRTHQHPDPAPPPWILQG